jgi:hypothetical protein
VTRTLSTYSSRSHKIKEKSIRENSGGLLKLLSWYTIKVSGYSSVDTQCVILEMLLVLQPHSTDLALEPISIFDVGQMLPLKVLRQVSRTGKPVSALFERQALLP